MAHPLLEQQGKLVVSQKADGQCHAVKNRDVVPKLPTMTHENADGPGREHDDDVLEAYMSQVSRELEGQDPGDLIADHGGLPIGQASMHVARSVTKREVAQQPKAEEACAAEWKRLQAQSTWDVTTVRGWSDVRREAEKTIHIGSLHELCLGKGSELPEGDTGHNYKGRVVF